MRVLGLCGGNVGTRVLELRGERGVDMRIVGFVRRYWGESVSASVSVGMDMNVTLWV